MSSPAKTDGVPAPGTDWRIRKIVASILPLLLALSVVVMGAGYVLEEMSETFLQNPTLFVLVPVMVATGGNVGTILSARLSTRLHLGDLTFSFGDSALVSNVIAVVLLSITMFSLLAVAAYGVGLLLGDSIGFADLLAVSLVSGLCITVLSIAVSITATYEAIERGVDPDDVVVPIVTSICDVLGVIIFTAVAVIVI